MLTMDKDKQAKKNGKLFIDTLQTSVKTKEVDYIYMYNII